MQKPFGNRYVPKVIEADEIRVGPVLITHDGNGTAGIWIGDGHDRDMVAIFSTPQQVGVGIYAKGNQQVCNVCLYVDEQGGGRVQFADDRGGPVVSVGLEELKKLLYGGK